MDIHSEDRVTPGLGTDPGKGVSDNLKVPFQPLGSRSNFKGNALVTLGSFLPRDGVTVTCFLSVCLSPVLQEPSWLCMSSAGCRTTPAGSCTATSLTTGGRSE